MNNPKQSLSPIAFGLIWLWIARVIFSVMFFAFMLYEWRRWPNGSPWLGPLGLVWYGGLDVVNLILCGVSLALISAVFLRPHLFTAVVSLLGILNWLFWGSLAEGIGC